MRILHLDSSIQGEASASRALTASVVEALKQSNKNTTINYHNLVEEAIPHLNGPIGAGFRPLAFSSFDEKTRAEHRRSEILVAELLDSDVIVIGAPMYNFSVASQLKAWIDRVMQPGKTFRYTPTGPEGLVHGKKVIVASTRGGSYLEGPLAPLDFQEGYLKASLGFMGIVDVHFIRAENMSRGDEARSKAMEGANSAVAPVIHLVSAA